MPLCWVRFRLSSSLLKLRLRSLCAGEGGGSPVLFVFCESERVTPMLSRPPSGVFCSLFRFAFRVFFVVRSSSCFVSCSDVRYLLLYSGFSFYCCSLPLRLLAAFPLFLWLLSGLLVSLTFHLEFVFFFGGLPCLRPAFPLSVVLTSSLLRLLVISFVAISSGVLSYT